eukprot:TRINITY_DN4114_c0_g1_i1.p1 TRINITY_DN4114_c0_g1~~TRINITY_DN4114_c0_g1_i1.p1  ORF type:complete len:499 (+),score=63.24 TRINITY_DN4114_c0_g1_i1:113-1609(+)
MEELQLRLNEMSPALLMSAMCGETGQSIDVGRAASSIHTLIHNCGVTDAEDICEATRCIVERLLNGNSFHRTLAEVLGIVTSRLAQDAINEAQAIQLNELTDQISMKVIELTEGARRFGSQSGMTLTQIIKPLEWYDNQDKFIYNSIEDDCIAKLHLGTITGSEITDHDGDLNSFRLNAMGMSYLINERWAGIVESLDISCNDLVTIKVETTNGEKWSFDTVYTTWRDSGRLLREIVSVAACSGVDLYLNNRSHDTIPWLLASNSYTEAGHEVSVWYENSDFGVEGWYTGTIEHFNSEIGRYTVLFDSGERAEHIHAYSINYRNGPLVGHFWSSNSPIWFDRCEVIHQGIVRWMVRRADPSGPSWFKVFPLIFATLSSKERLTHLKLALDMDGSLQNMWSEIVAAAVRIGLLSLACRVIFSSLCEHLKYTYELSDRLGMPELRSIPTSDAGTALTDTANLMPIAPKARSEVIPIDATLAQLLTFAQGIQEDFDNARKS